ncbi:sugar porter family MFS transporter [Chitinophaga rhizosphaerae]|uniref:sugar porter family MFS transporter n=1 Tax=Chitinophaga rhizosphaerae TaxID=1864947 RepID=UPI000F7FE94A|nr:sugar porter family MFS transporter [Chitinophaga rhizosphaerae]
MATLVPVSQDASTTPATVNNKYVYKVCAITALGGVMFGFDLVTISGAIQFLAPHFRLGDFEIGWAVGSINLGCIAGALLAGKLSDSWGRKKLLIVCAVLFAITGVGTGWAPDFKLFISFRLLSGVAVGAAALVCPMYTAEISPAHLRGRMVSFYQLAITLGILLAYLTNYFLLNSGPDNWRWMFTAQSVPAILFFAGLFLVAESPRWLVGKKRIAEARIVLSRIGGAEYARQQLLIISRSFKTEIKERVADLFDKGMRTILITGVFIAIFSQAVGQNSLFSYAPEIFRHAGMAEGSAFLQSLIIGVINLLFTFFAISMIDKVGRRTLLLVGTLSLFAIALALSTGFYFQWNGIWILIFVLLFIAVYSATIGPVTWVALSEIFPNRIRGNAMAACTFSLWLANFFSTSSFPVLKSHWGLPFTFVMHGIICLLYFLFVERKVPETKGKSLEDIERLLMK